jgi:hypothetical protein
MISANSVEVENANMSVWDRWGNNMSV